MTREKNPSPIQPFGTFAVFLDTEDTRQRWFTIGDLSRDFNVTLRTLRFYEDKGLMAPRREGLSRLYSREDRARLKLVLLCKRVGFSLAEIRDILALHDRRDDQSAALLERFRGQLGVLEQQKQEIEDGLMTLNDTIAQLTARLAPPGARSA